MIDPAHGYVSIKLRTCLVLTFPAAMPKQGKEGKRPAASTKGNAKKKSKGSKARGNAAGGSKLLDPQHNNGVAKQRLRNFLYDPVTPELDVACHRKINILGSHAHFKLMGRKSRAVFEFEARGYNDAHTFKEHGVDQITPAFRLKDCAPTTSPRRWCNSSARTRPRGRTFGCP